MGWAEACGKRRRKRRKRKEPQSTQVRAAKVGTMGGWMGRWVEEEKTVVLWLIHPHTHPTHTVECILPCKPS